MKSFRERNPVPIGVIGTIVLALVTAGVYFYQDLPLIGGGTTYQAEFSEAAGIRPDDEVRVAGIKVGEVTDVELEQDGASGRVVVSFRVEDAWVGDATTAAIKLKTLLGRKFLALHPTGGSDLDPDTPIPLDRTVTPYDVTEAFEDLASTAGAIDTDQLAASFRTISDTFADSPRHVRTALDGLTDLSRTIHSRDAQLAKLLANTRDVTSTLSGSNDEFDKLIEDGDLLLTELANRRDAIHDLLVGTNDLAAQLSGVVADNQRQLAPALARLDTVTDVLTRHADNLDRSLELAGPYFRLVNNATGSGRWIDNYLCGLIKPEPDPGYCRPPPGGSK
ncbi:MCE family protein [Actinophytocola gossypii]|uniref:MCE family protein n=1 Tax=Actinophytocola gossypii TaxID=2812003 RepID=A0ABT2JDW3_9PSEU|nr:MCE family protein [Actinophytocola gossypii]MCT2586071.1 MCE family protein [Actinophytocola gossypii]